MKIKVSFTLDIPKSSLAKLMELACTEDIKEVRDFVREEAKDYTWEYLDANGVIGVTVEGGEL